MKSTTLLDKFLALIGLMRKAPMLDTSYHDVVVIVNGTNYEMGNANYALQLHCTRCAGWRLYHVWGGKDTLLGGEFDGDFFSIVVKGQVLVHTEPSEPDEMSDRAKGAVKPPTAGWNGVLVNEPLKA